MFFAASCNKIRKKRKWNKAQQEEEDCLVAIKPCAILSVLWFSIHINNYPHPSNTHRNNHQRDWLIRFQIDIPRRRHGRTLMLQIRNLLLVNRVRMQDRIIVAKIRHGRWPVQQHLRGIVGMGSIAGDGWNRYWRSRRRGDPWRWVTG